MLRHAMCVIVTVCLEIWVVKLVPSLTIHYEAALQEGEDIMLVRVQRSLIIYKYLHRSLSLVVGLTA